MARIVLATTNLDKKAELLPMLEQTSFEVLTLADFPGCPEVIEDGETYEANAIKKAREVSLYTGEMALADDSGLNIDALQGAPGIFSARFSGEHATYESNIKKVLHKLQGVPLDKRTAKFVCCMALVDGESIKAVVQGEIKGVITEYCCGSSGFGYDPIFYSPEYEMTFAEMTSEFKNSVSHRAIALRKMVKKMLELNGGQ